MKIVTSLYGNKYASLLLVFLESLNQIDERLQVLVFWSDIDADILNPIKKNYSGKTNFIQVKNDVHIDSTSQSSYFSSLKSGKMSYLNKVYDYLDDGEDFLLIDCDTIINGEFSTVFEDEFDVAFTPLPEAVATYPVNTGVVFCRNNTMVRQLTKNMEKHVLQLSTDPEMHADSVEKYGAADQAAFCRIIGYRSDNQIDPNLVLNNISYKTLDYKYYNNFHSEENFTNIKIIHLKGSWQTLLFRGRSLQSMPNKGYEAIPIYSRFIELFLKSLYNIYDIKDLNKLAKKLDVRIPFYFRKRDNKLIVDQKSLFFYKFLEKIYRTSYNRNYSKSEILFRKFLFKEYAFWK